MINRDELMQDVTVLPELIAPDPVDEGTDNSEETHSVEKQLIFASNCYICLEATRLTELRRFQYFQALPAHASARETTLYHVKDHLQLFQ